MENFTLTYEIINIGGGEVNVKLYPSDTIISEYVADYRVFTSEAEALSSMTSYINEMTPLLYDYFINMDNILITTRNNYQLV